MRTKLSLENDVLEAARELAVMRRQTLGQVISDLAPRSLAARLPRIQMGDGLPLLPRRRGSQRVTSELVRRLEENAP